MKIGFVDTSMAGLRSLCLKPLNFLAKVKNLVQYIMKIMSVQFVKLIHCLSYLLEGLVISKLNSRMIS